MVVIAAVGGWWSWALVTIVDSGHGHSSSFVDSGAGSLLLRGGGYGPSSLFADSGRGHSSLFVDRGAGSLLLGGGGYGPLSSFVDSGRGHSLSFIDSGAGPLLLGGGYGPSSPFVDLVMVPCYRSWMVAGAGLAVRGWWRALVAVR